MDGAGMGLGDDEGRGGGRQGGGRGAEVHHLRREGGRK